MGKSMLAGAMAALLLLFGPAAALAGGHSDDDDAPQVEHTKTSSALEQLPRLPVSQRKVVTIYQFKSGVPGIANNALTDMFVNALMESGAFLVAERENLAPDIATEKTLNGTGKSDGDTAQKKIAAAKFIFSGTVSENNSTQDQTQNTLSLGGMQLGGNNSKGKIAIDVRVYDVDSGLVLDSIVVSKTIQIEVVRRLWRRQPRQLDRRPRRPLDSAGARLQHPDHPQRQHRQRAARLHRDRRIGTGEALRQRRILSRPEAGPGAGDLVKIATVLEL